MDGAPRERIFYKLYASRAAYKAQEHTRQFLTWREPLLEGKQAGFLSLTGGKTPVHAPAGRDA